MRGFESTCSVWKTSTTCTRWRPSALSARTTSPGLVAIASSRTAFGRISSRCSSFTPDHPISPPFSRVDAQSDDARASSVKSAPPLSMSCSPRCISSDWTRMWRTRTAETALERVESTFRFHSARFKPTATSDCGRSVTMSSRRTFFSLLSARTASAWSCLVGLVTASSSARDAGATAARLGPTAAPAKEDKGARAPASSMSSERARERRREL